MMNIASLFKLRPGPVEGVHPEPGPEPGMPTRSRGSGSSSRPEPASIVPGGGGGFASQSASATFRNRPLAAPSAIIHLKGSPDQAYRVGDPHSSLPQWATAIDPQTGGPSSQRRYVQRDDKGEWVPAKRKREDSDHTTGIELASATLPGDSVTYFIKDPSNTRTPQPLYLKNSNGVLKQTGKSGTYDGHGKATRDNGLRGGTDASKDARNHRIHKAEEKVLDVVRKCGVAETELVKLNEKVSEARRAWQVAKQNHTKALADFTQAQHNYTGFVGRQDMRTTLAKGVREEMDRLYALKVLKGGVEIKAKAAVGTAATAHTKALRDAIAAQQNLRSSRQELSNAKKELDEAKTASY